MKHTLLFIILFLFSFSIVLAAPLIGNFNKSNETGINPLLSQATGPAQNTTITSQEPSGTDIYSLIIVIVIVLLILAGGVAAYYYFTNKSKPLSFSGRRLSGASLQNYIDDSRAKGFSDTAIKNQLILSGYRKEDFDDYFKK